MVEFLKKYRFWILTLALLAGGALRFYGLDWGLPFRYHTDENAFINAVNAMRKAPYFNYLNPEWFYHPSLGFYVLCLFSFIASLFMKLDLPTVHLLGRIYAALCGTLCIWAAYLLGKKLYGRAVGALSSVFLAFAVIHIQSSHYYTPDVPLDLYLLITMLFAADVMTTGRRRSYVLSGIFSGVAVATKYWAPTVMMILVAHLIWFFTRKGRKLRWIINRNLLLSGIAAFLTFFVCSPYILLDAKEAVPKIIHWAAVTTGKVPQVYTLHCEHTRPYLYHVTTLFPWAVGVPLLIVGILGCFWALFRHRRADLLILSWIFINFLLIGSWYIKFTRYILPLVSFLCIVGARFLVDLYEALSGRLARFLVASAAAATVLLTGLYALMFVSVYAPPHSRTAAAAWMRANLKTNALVVVDGASNVRVPLEREDPAWSRLRFRYLDFISLFNEIPSQEEKEKYLREVLSGADALVLNEAYWRYYRDVSDLYPVEARFWEDLFAGRLGFRLVKTFKTQPHIGPFSISDDSAEMSFAFSDHPAVFVFLRDETAKAPSREPAP